MKKIIAIITALLMVCSVIVPMTFSVTADTGTKLTNLYNEEYHDWHTKTSGKKVIFDAENKKITMNGGQAKTLVNYSEDMTTFDASVIIQGNTIETSASSNYGLIYGGMIFHVDETDFNSSTFSFNSTGYAVLIKREKNATAATVIVRYITNNSTKKELSFKTSTIPFSYDGKIKLNVSVTSDKFIITVTNEAGTTTYATKEYPLDNTASYPATACYESGAIGLVANGYHEYYDFTVTATAPMANIPQEETSGGSGSGEGGDSADKLAEKFDLYGEFTTDADNYTTASATQRGTLKSGSADNFSTDVTIKLNSKAEAKAGIIFRASNLGTGNDNMQGYALILDTTKGSDIRLFLYKYGPKVGTDTNAYLGRIGNIIIDTDMTLSAGKEFVLYLNVYGKKMEAYFYDKANPSVKSETLSATLTSATEQSYDNGQYYSTGKIGFYIANGYYINATDGLVIKDGIEISGNDDDEGDTPVTGRPAVDKSKGSATKGEASSIKNVTASNVSNANNLAAYAADWDNYTFYSTSTTNKFLVTDKGLIAPTAGTKRAMLDGVTVSGFHASVAMKVTDEGTMRSGIVFRVNDIEGSLSKDGTLPADAIQGYAAVLYKTPGTTDSYARVVMLIYKYGIADGKHKFLGTVASKSSEVPLTGFEKTQKAAAGQELVMDVNIIGDEVTMYFYNKNKPELISEKLIADLNNETDVESNTPSIKGVHYDKGAIGLTTTNQGIFTSFTVGEPNYPSTDVGDLSDIDSYTMYGSGAMQEGEYITSNSSGTKKLIVNNLTVKDFKASVDMTIDPNGNLKTGFFFRVNEVGNGADAQTGWAIVVTRNYATNGETNPNRIDIVLFKWGYNKGKLSYLGEVSREVYKSATSFVDGKMAGEELTFVVEVKGAAIDATLYHKENPTNKPVTFSTNLKFAGKNEKGDVAYFESGSMGLYLGNSVSDPVNYNRVRNFHIDDGSGVEVKAKARTASDTPAVASTPSVLGIPLTGENTLIMISMAIFIISAGVILVLYNYNKRGKHEIGEGNK